MSNLADNTTIWTDKAPEALVYTSPKKIFSSFTGNSRISFIIYSNTKAALERSFMFTCDRFSDVSSKVGASPDTVLKKLIRNLSNQVSPAKVSLCCILADQTFFFFVLSCLLFLRVASFLLCGKTAACHWRTCFRASRVSSSWVCY